MSQATSDSSPQAVAGASSTQSGNDALLNLHKMSTTAGLGSADYVAVNPLAVTAVVLGAASWLLWVFKQELLLVIPLAAAVCAVVAIWQVARSNGTQTGYWAALGLISALVVSGLFGAGKVSAARVKAAEADAVGQVVTRFGEYAAAQEWEKAYALFHPTFQERISPTRFVQLLKIATDNPSMGKFEGFRWNGRIELTGDPAGEYGAVSILIFKFEKGEVPGMPSIYFIKTPQGWQILRSPDLFPTGAVIMPQ